MKLKELKRLLDSFDNEELEVFIKLKAHYDPGKLWPFSDGKMESIQNQFRHERIDFDCINLVLANDYLLTPED